MEQQFDLIQIEKSLPKKETRIKKYVSIMYMLHNCDVSKYEIFRKSYNDFYKMRQRSREYYDIYFKYLEQQKNNLFITFGDILTYIYENTGRCEASFSSKFLATINPNMPVWDTNVLSNLSIKVPYNNCKNRIEKIINIYSELCEYYKGFMTTDNAKQIIRLFDDIFPQYNSITDIKKIDLAIWSLGVKPQKSKSKK